MLSTDENDWILFYTQSEAIETKAIVEIIIVEKDILKGTTRTRGIGYSTVPLFYNDMPTEVEVFEGSPRDVLKYLGQPGAEPPKTDSILHFQVS